MSDQHEHKYSYLVEILKDLQTVWFLTNVFNVAIILDDYLFIHLLFIHMQCHNYISDFYNKPNHLKIGRKLIKLCLFKKVHTPLDTMLQVRKLPVTRWPAARTRHLAFIMDIHG